MAKREDRIGTILGAVEEAKSVAEELRDELQEWYDDLTESFQNGDKGNELQEAIDQLEEAISALEDVECGNEFLHNLPITYSQVVYPRSTYMSRSKRLEVSVCALEGVPCDLDGVEGIPEDDEDELEEMLTRCSEALDALQSVCFPSTR